MSEAKNEFGSSDQLGLVDKMRRWLDGETTHSSVTLIQAAILEIERLNSVAQGNFEAAVEALDGCAIDVAAERERIASACWDRRGHFASDGAARAFAELVRAGKA